MNKYFIIIIFCFVFISCGKQSADDKQSNGKPKVGLVFDIGGRGDKSFNDAAYNGLERAKRELGIEFEVVDPGDGADREAALRRLASNSEIGLIFGVGFIFTEDINTIAKDFPSKKFACVDYSVSDPAAIPQNVSALEFNEEEGSFLVGMIAALTSKTNTVGFIGGMESALIRKFETGFEQGVKYANPEVKVVKAYISVNADGFKNVAKGKEIALSQYSQGADIIYHASGLSGLGLFEAAREKNKLAIGVDMNQYNEAPGFVLTSMTKQVDEAVFQTIKDFINSSFKGGVRTFGTKDKGVDYVFDENNRNLISEEVYHKVEAAKQKLINGEITVQSK